MNAARTRRIVIAVAAVSTAALTLSACGKSAPAAGPATVAPKATPAADRPATPAKPAPVYTAGTPLISDGTSTVTIGGVPVRFPTAVTGAVWSADGSRVAFVDGSGNIATAHPDGSGLVVLVTAPAGGKLSQPSWEGGVVEFVTTGANGVSRIGRVGSTGKADPFSETYAFLGGTWSELTGVSAPSAKTQETPDDEHDTVVFQYQGAKGPEVWIHQRDANARGGADPAYKLTDGSWPALAPDGHFAFVGTNGQVMAAVPAKQDPAKQDPAGVKAVQLTTTASSPTHLAWTADGKSVAYSTPTGIDEVDADGSGTVRHLSSKPGTVSFLPGAKDRLIRLSGGSATDLTAASLAISHATWFTTTGTTAGYAGAGPTGHEARTVTLISAADPAAALAALNDASGYGPVLLVGAGNTADDRIVAEVKRVLGTPPATASVDLTFPAAGTVQFLGATGTIPAAYETALTAAGYHVNHAPQPAAAKPAAPIAVIDPADPAAGAARTAATAQGWQLVTLSGGAVAAADRPLIIGNAQNGTRTVITFGTKAAAAVTAVTATQSFTPNITAQAYGTTPEDLKDALATASSPQDLTVAPDTTPADRLLAALTIGFRHAVVPIDPATGPSATLKAYLDTGSARITSITVIDNASEVSPETANSLVALSGGTLGYDSVANPMLDSAK